MNFLMIFRTAWRSLAVNKMRSLLTALGIIIGVASVIMVVALSQGATAGITERISSMGTNVLTIRPSGGMGAMRGSGGAAMRMEDVAAIAQLPYVKYIAPSADTSVTVTAGNLTWSASVSGTTPALQQIRSWKLNEGGFFSQEDVDGASAVAVIGSTVADSLFPSESPVGKTIRLNGITFTVIGLLPTQGAMGMGSDQDNAIYVPLTTAQMRLLGGTGVRNVIVQAENSESLTFLKDTITTLLRQRHRLAADAEDDFRIMDSAELLATVQDTSRILSLLLGGIAAVSLVVGGIGVMNIMLVSVTERTREIGIRMAVGATTNVILSQFLVEAVMLCIIGGALGTLLGWGLSKIFASVAGWPTVVPVWAVVMAIAFSMVIGVIFGYYPARKAAHSDPIEALRYE
ncbi:MAG: ABC transporter permease [Acidobacteriota bacterium]